jgi:glycosyltransferase involved in cell wall biosynthesis
MKSIVIFTPRIKKKTFTGGRLTLFEYANGLVALGHKVTVVPIEKSYRPDWFDCQFDLDLGKPQVLLRNIYLGFAEKKPYLIMSEFGKLLSFISQYGSYSFRKAMQIEWVRNRIPHADISIATSFETAIIVGMHEATKKFYFAQHFEPLFVNESENPKQAYIDAILSYSIPKLNIISNSTWLKNTLMDEVGIESSLCINAIDNRVFFPNEISNLPDEFTVVSYGGRNAEWKGFIDLARAMTIAREKIPNLKWVVFGNAELPSQNTIFSYKSLGFVQGEDLRRAYANSHVLVAPAWYESFPLYPLEAMACGTALITTSKGTEDYAIHLENALIVPEKNPNSIADAIVYLFNNPELRKKLALRGSLDARKFTWDQSVARMSEILGL